MSYNNFDENRPNQNNGILTDIDSINEALNILREQGLSTNFPTNTTAGMPFARLETRDDNSLQDKVVVYRRNSDDDDWLKVYDEEYDIYDKISEIETSTENDLTVLNDKITDIEDGTTKVPNAENADNAESAEKLSGEEINNFFRRDYTLASSTSPPVSQGETKEIQALVPEGYIPVAWYIDGNMEDAKPIIDKSRMVATPEGYSGLSATVIKESNNQYNKLRFSVSHDAEANNLYITIYLMCVSIL